MPTWAITIISHSQHQTSKPQNIKTSKHPTSIHLYHSWVFCITNSVYQSTNHSINHLSSLRWFSQRFALAQIMMHPASQQDSYLHRSSRGLYNLTTSYQVDHNEWRGMIVITTVIIIAWLICWRRVHLGKTFTLEYLTNRKSAWQGTEMTESHSDVMNNQAQPWKGDGRWDSHLSLIFFSC